MSRVGLKLRFVRSMSVVAVVCVAGATLAAGCSSPQPATPTLSRTASPIPTATPKPTETAASCHVGISWDNYNYVESWDRPAMLDVFDREGGIRREVDSRDRVQSQEEAVDSFVSEGVDVILVRRVDYGSTSAALKRAVDAGIPVVAEDVLLEQPGIVWVAFDSVATGRMEARAMLAARPTGNYVIIKGHPGQTADLQRQGIGEVLKPALESGAIKIVAETYVNYWDPTGASNEMTSILGKSGKQIDAVIVESDGMADGVLEALRKQGLAGRVAVAGAGGAGGDPFGVRNLASGVQLVSIWHDHARLGTAAAQAVVELCRNRDIAKVSGAKPITSPAGNQMSQIVLQPQTITRDNLDVILKADAWTKRVVCYDAAFANSHAACQALATSTP